MALRSGAQARGGRGVPALPGVHSRPAGDEAPCLCTNQTIMHAACAGGHHSQDFPHHQEPGALHCRWGAAAVAAEPALAPPRPPHPHPRQLPGHEPPDAHRARAGWPSQCVCLTPLPDLLPRVCSSALCSLQAMTPIAASSQSSQAARVRSWCPPPLLRWPTLAPLHPAR